MKKLLSTFLLAGTLLQANANDPQLEPYAGSPGWQETKQERLKWFKDAKFGMFIHFGLYAYAGGHWPPKDGKKYPQHYSEWIRNWARVPEPEYGDLNKAGFKPVEGCTDEWAELAKEAGMKYAVLTTKHHDGYTLFNSKEPYSIKNNVTRSTNISPKGRDLVGEYSESMRSNGLKVGYYYSLIDWQHPHAVPQSRRWPIAKNADHSIYTKYMNGHIKQLFSEYGKADLLWVDYSSNRFQGKFWDTRNLLDQLYKMQPQMLVNNRFWNNLNNDKGDYFTPEKFVPQFASSDRAFEVCHTMNESFGYSYHDKKWKSTTEVIHLLVDVVSKGGTLLLNIGPDPQGHVPEGSVKALKGTGQWLKTYGEAIYSTRATPFSKLPSNIRVTRKENESSATLYFHILEWPKDGKVKFLGLNNKASTAVMLGSKEVVAITQKDGQTIFQLPAKASNEHASVVKLEINEKLDVETEILPVQAGDRSVEMDASYAKVSGPQLRIETNGNKANIGYWLDKAAKAEFAFKVIAPGPASPGGVVTKKPGKYKVVATIAAPNNAGGTIEVSFNGQSVFKTEVKTTGAWQNYQDQELGVITITKSGVNKIAFKAAKMDSAFINLRNVKLVPID